MVNNSDTLSRTLPSVVCKRTTHTAGQPVVYLVNVGATSANHIRQNATTIFDRKKSSTKLNSKVTDEIFLKNKQNKPWAGKNNNRLGSARRSFPVFSAPFPQPTLNKNGPRILTPVQKNGPH